MRITHYRDDKPLLIYKCRTITNKFAIHVRPRNLERDTLLYSYSRNANGVVRIHRGSTLQHTFALPAVRSDLFDRSWLDRVIPPHAATATNDR